MFVAILSSTVVSNALPRIIADLTAARPPYTWVVTATLLATTASTPIWGKLADLFSKKLLVQIALVIFVARLGARRPLPERRHAHRLPRASRASASAASPRSPRSIMAAMISPARARPLQRLPRRGLRRRHRRRPAARRRHRRHLLARLALVLLRRRAVRRRRAGRAAEDPAPAGGQARGRRSTGAGATLITAGGLAAADLGLLRRRQVRLGVLADRRRWSAARSLLGAARRPGRVAGQPSRSSRCGCSATAPSPSPSSPASLVGVGDVRRARSSSASTSRSAAASRPTDVRPDDHPDDRRPAASPPPSPARSSPAPAGGSATWSPAASCSPPASR